MLAILLYHKQNMKSKLKYFIFLLLIVVFFGSLFYINDKAESDVSNQRPIFSVGSNISPQSYTISFNAEKTDLPKSAKALTQEPEKLDTKTIENVALNLGFTEITSDVIDIFDGQTITYADENSSFVARPEVGEMKFTLSVIPENVTSRNYSDERYVNLSYDYLIENEFVDDNQISFQSIDYIMGYSEGIDTDVSKENANLVQTNFSPTTNSTPIITLDPNSSPVRVRLLTNGNIFSANVFRILVQESGEEFELVPFDSIEKQISSAKIISLDDIPLSDIQPNSIKHININSITFAYLWKNPKEENLTPIYLLEGTAQLEGDSEVNVVMYMLAVK